MRVRSMGSILAALVLCCAGCSTSATDPSDTVTQEPELERPSVVQAEKASVKSGGQSIPRSNAEESAVYHLDEGQEIQFQFTRLAPAEYQLSCRYSDDGGGDVVTVYADGVEVGRWKTENTRSSGQEGSGWNQFATSPSIQLGRLEGARAITLRDDSSDGWGVDLDSVTFSAIE